MSRRSIEQEWKALKKIESSFRTHPLERALLALKGAAWNVGDNYYYKGHRIAPRDLVRVANLRGANIYYPITNPHPKALTKVTSWKLSNL